MCICTTGQHTFIVSIIERMISPNFYTGRVSIQSTCCMSCQIYSELIEAALLKIHDANCKHKSANEIRFQLSLMILASNSGLSYTHLLTTKYDALPILINGITNAVTDIQQTLDHHHLTGIGACGLDSLVQAWIQHYQDVSNIWHLKRQNIVNVLAHAQYQVHGCAFYRDYTLSTIWQHLMRQQNGGMYQD